MRRDPDRYAYPAGTQGEIPKKDSLMTNWETQRALSPAPQGETLISALGEGDDEARVLRREPVLRGLDDQL